MTPERLDIEARADERKKIADELEKLGDGRMEYVTGVVGREPRDSTEIAVLPSMLQIVYGEATGARWLARIVRGDTDTKGWLPSWRWPEG